MISPFYASAHIIFSTIREHQCSVNSNGLCIVISDFLTQDALRTFSPGNRIMLVDNIKLAPVLIHMYASGVITAKQLQRIESERTDIDRAEHVWNLVKTKLRYLDGVRDALKSTGQEHLADILE